MADDPSAPIPAATLVIFRDTARGAPELLMVERAAAMAFAGGAMVFPGGRVDPGDHALAREIGGDAEDVAGRIAAIRETIEEVGVAIGIAPMPDAATLARVRAALHGGEAFGPVLARFGLTLRLHALVPFARWRPDHRRSRNFDTRFYLARFPGNAPPPSSDGGETVRFTWITAARALAAADAGEIAIIFPTRRNLERLARFAGFEAAVADAAAHAIRAITPWQEDRGGVPHLCIPDDLGYPVTAAPLADLTRG